jgi:hypothetical protein
MFTLPVASILPRRPMLSRTRKSVVFRQIHASVREIGLIEPIVVYPQEGKGFLLLDGHLRLEVLKELGTLEVKCLLATDQEGYTYNKRVNHIPPVAQHFMLLEALKNGVPEERVAAALNVDVSAIRSKTKMLDGICPEVVELLRNRNLSAVLFPVLRRMKPIIQIATVELMVLRNDFSVSFAKTRLALTPPDLLIASTTPRQLRADSEAAQAILQEDTQTLVKNLKSVEQSYGTDILTLTVACAYMEKLLGNDKVSRYLGRHHRGTLETVESLLTDVRPPKESHVSTQPGLGL